MLIHRDHKGSLYKFHPLYEILCDGGDLAGTLECSSTKTGPRDRRCIGKRGYLGSRAYNKIYARDLFILLVVDGLILEFFLLIKMQAIESSI